MRSTVDILRVIDEVFEGVLGTLPSYNTIGNWIKKCGLDVYNSSAELYKDKAYAEIIDESMMIGSEKLLLTLGIPSTHPGHPLCHKEVSILDMSVATHWTAEGVKIQLDKAAQKVGHLPQYVAIMLPL